MSQNKRIAILTSGGDCAGLNAVIRAVVLRAEGLGWEVIGIMSGAHGLISSPPQTITLHRKNVDTVMMRQGGTILGTTNKGDPFAYPMPDGSTKDLSDDMVAGFRSLNCDALIGIGGDGSLEILRHLSQKGGFPLIGVPKTIDNDLGMTESAVGFDTAVAVATEALDRLQPTAASHDRIMILEVMGRDAGHIALAAGIAGGADVILIPEIPYDIQKVADHIKEIRKKGRNFALVVVSEAVRTQEGSKMMNELYGGQKRLGGIGHVIGAQIAELCKAETRVTVLGHVQRGGQPSAQDRLIAAAFGVHAVELIKMGKFNRMVAWSNRQVIDVSIDDAVKHNQQVEKQGSLVKAARGLGISFGDGATLP
ncbi:MAG TPA: ATP-dependent 6-phosphofructokinase, partial [Alphaproteobacteria bacterium]|nr:ATP-dependent 6-phosphofructokinase [Alphaproteobacteria bacterium]